MAKVSPKNENKIVHDKEELVVDCCCFVSKDPCSRRVICYNLRSCIGFIFMLLYFIFIVVSFSLEGYMYFNSKYSRDEQLAIIILNVIAMETVVVPAIFVSCCINKTIWPVIIFNIVYVVVQMLLLFAVLVNVED